jgi:hypothetical protein
MICEIESTFIRKLENTGLYKEPVEGLLPELVKRFPNVTRQQAEDAAEQIIRTHGSGTFPKYPACERALKAAIAGAVQPQMAAQSGHGITAATYFDECKKWLNRFGPGYVVIHRVRDAAAWETWIAYYRQIGLTSNASLMSQPRDEWTVPTQYPDSFDRQAPAPLTDAEIARLRTGNRRRTQDEIDRVADHMEGFRHDIPSRRRQERVQRQHLDAGAFDRWAEEQASQPIPAASPELSSRMAQRSAA